MKVIMKPTNFPTQGQPNPRKKWLKVAFGPLFPITNIFFVGWDWFYVGNRLRETFPKQILRKHPSGISYSALLTYWSIISCLIVITLYSLLGALSPLLLVQYPLPNISYSVLPTPFSVLLTPYLSLVTPYLVLCTRYPVLFTYSTVLHALYSLFLSPHSLLLYYFTLLYMFAYCFLRARSTVGWCSMEEALRRTLRSNCRSRPR